MDSWEDDSLSSLSEWVSERDSGVLVVLQRRRLSHGGQGGWEMVETEKALLDSRPGGKLDFCYTWPR